MNGIFLSLSLGDVVTFTDIDSFNISPEISKDSV